MYSHTTRSVVIRVAPTYLEEESAPEDSRYVWAYRIRIENAGGQILHLRRRRWSIIDANGHIQTVDGSGVVGMQPVLEPGAVFIYTSGVPLRTPSGIMSGCYQMRTEAGDVFEAQIPAFSLDCPHERRSLN